MIRNAFHLLLGQAATTALAIVLTGAIGRAVGPSDFGLWYLLITTTGFVLVFVDWGYAPYVIREVARRPVRAGELTGTVLAIRAATALLACAPAAVIMRMLGHGSRTGALTALMIATSTPLVVVTSYSWVFRGRERMDLEAAVNVALKALAVLLTLSLLGAGMGLAGVIVAQALAAAIALVLAMSFYYKLHLPRLCMNTSTARELIREAAPMFTLGLMISLQPYIDANLVTGLTPSNVMGWYGAAASLSGTLLAPAVILGGSVYPRLSRAIDDRVEFARLVNGALRAILFVSMLGAVGTYLFADVAIRVVYASQNFGPAVATLRAFSPALFLVSVDILLGYAILASGKVGLFARAKVTALVVTTLLDLLLIPFCQSHFGNGGIGVMLSCNGGELVMLAAALRLIPSGTLDRRALIDFGRALGAGGCTLLIVRVVQSGAPFVAIPFAVASYTALSVALGLVKRSDVERLTALFARKTSRTLAQPTASPVS